MTDSIESLRWQRIASQGIAIERELRIEIERLRAERDDLAYDVAMQQVTWMEANIERLRTEREELLAALHRIQRCLNDSDAVMEITMDAIAKAEGKDDAPASDARPL